MTTNYKPSVGDRVRVVLEGKVILGTFAVGFAIGNEDVENCIVPSADHVVSVELLSPPEPPPGSVVLDADNRPWRRVLTTRLNERWYGALAGYNKAITWDDLVADEGPLRVVHTGPA